MTDVGMCGDYDSIIGMEKDEPLRRSTTKIASGRLEPALGPAALSGLAVEIDDQTGLAHRVAPLRIGPGPRRRRSRISAHDATASMSDVLHGRCSCGAIRFVASAAPFQVSWCHCKDCRRQTGAPAVVWAGFKTDEVTFQGTPKRRRSSEHVTRAFCADCGTPIILRARGAAGRDLHPRRPLRRS